MGKVLNGFTAETPMNLQLDAGVLLRNIAITDNITEEELRILLEAEITSRTNTIGATSGGGSFESIPILRDVAKDLDGKRMKIKGLMVCDGVDIKMTTTLKEITIENISLAMGNASVVGNKIVPKFNIEDTDYSDNIVWVGATTGDDLLVIILENVLNTSGLSLTWTDKGTGGIEIELEPFLDLSNMEHMPVAVYRLPKTTTP